MCIHVWCVCTNILCIAIDEQKKIKHRSLKKNNITLPIIDADSVTLNTEIEIQNNDRNEMKLSFSDSKSDAREAFEILPITPAQSIHVTPTFDHPAKFDFSSSKNKVNRKITPVDINSMVSDFELMKSSSVITDELSVDVCDIPNIRARSHSPLGHRLELSPDSKSASVQIVSNMAKKAKEDRKHILKEKYERRIKESGTKKKHHRKKNIDDTSTVNKKVKRTLNSKPSLNRKSSSDALSSTSIVQQLRAEVVQLKEELKKEREQSNKKQKRIRDLESSNKSLRNTLSLLENNKKLKQSSGNISGKKKILHCRPKSVASFTLGNGGLITRSSFRIIKPHPFMSLPPAAGSVPYSDGRSSGLGIDLLDLKMGVLENVNDDILPITGIYASRSINGSPKSNIKRPRLQSLQSF